MSAFFLRASAAIVAAWLVTAAAAATALAAPYNYVEWSAADVAGGTASGTIPLAGDPDGGVGVTFTATTADGGPGTLYGAQIDDSGTNYWTPASTYESSEVDDAPPTPDIIQLAGGDNDTYTVTLSEPIVDPIMAIVSLGAAGTPTTYNFDSPFTIVSQGTDSFGGSSTSLVQLPDNVLQGSEGSGVIQFIGTYTTFSWTVPTPEVWHGFTFGILTSAALYDGGGPDGSTTLIASDGAASEPPSDASVSSDAAVSRDAAGSVDAETAASDAGGSPDAATSAASSSGAAAVSPAAKPGSSSGCGCDTVGATPGETTAMASIGALAALVGFARRRRSRRA